MSDTPDSSSENAILIVDDDPDFMNGVRRSLRASGIGPVTMLQESSRLLEALAAGNYRVLLLDWVMPDPSGSDLLPEVLRLYPEVQVVILSGVRDLDNVVSCIKQGAYDYVTKPADMNRLASVVQGALKARELATRTRKLTGYLLGEPLDHPENFSDIVTCNDKMMAVFKVVEAVADSRQPVLITGETGVGKELIATALHRSSNLRGRLVTVNAAGIDDFMFSDTLFGHKRGAYTGATEGREGLIESARGGTLFLDEIGDLSRESQVKLLRLLQQGEYYRLGSDVLLKSDVRIIAASNADLPMLMKEGGFRRDLYFRLNIHSICIPPLRERRSDIIPLAEHFVTMTARELRRPVQRLSKELCQALLGYSFPGNVRELFNMACNAVTGSHAAELQPSDFTGLAPGKGIPGELIRRVGGSQFVLNGVFRDFPTVEEVQELLMHEAVYYADGNRSLAAKMLGLSRPTLVKWLERAGYGGNNHEDNGAGAP